MEYVEEKNVSASPPPNHKITPLGGSYEFWRRVPPLNGREPAKYVRGLERRRIYSTGTEKSTRKHSFWTIYFGSARAGPSRDIPNKRRLHPRSHPAYNTPPCEVPYARLDSSLPSIPRYNAIAEHATKMAKALKVTVAELVE